MSMIINKCSDVPKGSSSGVYPVITSEGESRQLFCDMDTVDGPWVVIQRRTSGDVDFYRDWADYKNGFGDILGNYWIGNDIIHILTNTPRILRVELEAWDGRKGYAQYSKFQLANEHQNYTLFVQGFTGNVSYDAMAVHNGSNFSTYDRDNDYYPSFDCAGYYRGGWWYTFCYQANLNGPIKVANGKEDSLSMTWWCFPNIDQDYIPLKKSKMMMR
ncbi:angiopoietin-related protein 7-like [Pecten maximus]|uniref:angiopoietin-related protein 7-like n=1 Tax=Pecten maximus TaxID=6579 RepID=UPI001458D242|nr:angiopoietin-related protein 7-like [Pecten maximus]